MAKYVLSADANKVKKQNQVNSFLCFAHEIVLL